jgi:hypothetical protein
VFKGVQFPTGDFGLKYSVKDNCRIEIGCAFFVPFFAQAKKGNT